MIWVSRAKTQEVKKLNEELNARYCESDIVFVLRADNVTAVGALCYDEKNNSARIGKFYHNGEFSYEYKDLLIRSILNSVRDAQNLKIIADYDDYYRTLGFMKTDCGYMEAAAAQIVFDSKCAHK